MRREVTATIVLKALAESTARFPKNARADSIAGASHAFQFETQPMFPLAALFFKSTGARHWLQ